MSRPKLYMVECCGSCEHAGESWDGDYTCGKYHGKIYGKYEPETVLPWMCCADYEKDKVKDSVKKDFDDRHARLEVRAGTEVGRGDGSPTC